MGAAENKEIVRKYFEAVNKGDSETVVGTFADDCVWWVPPGSDMAGTYEGKEAVLGLFGQGVALYDPNTPLKVEIQELVADGDKVAAQVVISAKTAKGKPYKNHYHFAFRLRNGQFVHVKEYVDTAYAHRVLFS